MILNNYYNIMSYVMFNRAPNIVRYDGMDFAPSYRGLDIYTYMQYMKTAYNKGYGVVLGKGDSPEDYYDYKLSGSIISGYTFSMTISTGRDSEGAYVRGKYTITNNNSADFTIKEVGLLGYGNSTNDSGMCLLDRTLLETPITITAGGVGQLEYTVRVNIPYKEFPLDFNQEGVHGVSWYYYSSSVNLTRLGDSAGWSRPAPATDLETVGTSPFDEIMPWAGMKRYNIIDGNISFSEDDEGFDEAAYDTVVYIPPFYYAVQEDQYQQKMQWAISMEEKEGFTLHPGSGRYVGRFHTAKIDSVYYSRSGYTPTYNVTRASARTQSHSKGDKWWQLDIATWSALQLLYLIEFASWNSQNYLGYGNNSGSRLNTGRTTGALYHTIKRSGNSNQYRWIENPTSNLFTWIDGVMNSGYYPYLGTDNSSFADSTTGLASSGINSYNNNGRYIYRYGLSKAFPWAFIPKAHDAYGAYNTYVTDYWYGGAQNTFPLVGGDYSSTSSTSTSGGGYQAYGFFYLYNGYSSSSTSSNIGTRLIYIP